MNHLPPQNSGSKAVLSFSRGLATPRQIPGSTLTPSSQEPLLVSAAVATELLGVSPRTLWTLTHEGGLPHVKMGRRVLYSPDSLRAWIIAQEVHCTKPFEHRD